MFSRLFMLLLVLAQPAFSSPLKTRKERKIQTLAKAILQDGDLVFQTSRSSQSQAIKKATHSIYTHMGMVFLKQGKPFVLEAVQPVKFTPFLQWVARGEQGYVVVKRLKNAKNILTPEVLEKMRVMAQSFLGRDYDLTFQWDDKRLYCSELVYKLYERAAGVQIGTLQKAGEFDLQSTEVKQKIKERFGNKPKPFHPNELVISPQSMFEDPKLMVVE